MRTIKTILLLFIALNVGATNYYVKNGGNDAASGLDDDNAWETIVKVNGETFSAGDSILFKRGDRFVGQLIPPNSGSVGSYIVFGAYGTGAKPIITPNDTIDGITWTLYSDSVYWTTDITYEPGNMLINGTTKINKINNHWVNTTPTDSYYDNLKADEILKIYRDKEYTYSIYTFEFWDGLDALYFWDGDTTFLRFREGENPNDSALYISVEDSSAVFIDSKSNIVIQNLNLIGGEYGVYLKNSDTCTVEYCKIESSNIKIRAYTTGNDITISNDTLTNDYLSSYNPGAWGNATTAEHYINYHYYAFFKFRIGTTQSTTADQAVGFTNIDNSTINDNTILYCVNGIDVGDKNNLIYNNYIEGTSSVGIHYGAGADSTQVYNNEIVNSNIAFRFQYVDDPGPRTFYLYRNTVYNPSAGQVMFIHYGGSDPSNVVAYIYHNSFICYEGVQVSTYADDSPPDGTGFVFVNNIISSSQFATYGWSTMNAYDTLMVWDYNWVSGNYYTSSTAVWSPVPSNNWNRSTFWNAAVDPPDFTNLITGEVIDSAVDITSSFTLWGDLVYAALPDLTNTVARGAAFDIGAIETGDTIEYILIDTSLAVGLNGDTIFTMYADADSIYFGGFEDGVEKWWSLKTSGSDNATAHYWRYMFTQVVADTGAQVGQTTRLDTVRVRNDSLIFYVGEKMFPVTNRTVNPLGFGWLFLIIGLFIGTRKRL